MIPVTAAKWMSRLLFVVGLGLFAATLAYVFTRSGPTTIRPDGSTITSVSEAEMGILGMLFSCTGWSICAAVGVQTLVSSASAGRALVRLGQPLGLALVFAGPMLWTSGSQELAVPLVVAGVVALVLSKILHFAFFGARDALRTVEKGIGGIEDAIADRSQTWHGLAFGSGLVSSPQSAFLSESLDSRYPAPEGPTPTGPVPGVEG